MATIETAMSILTVGYEGTDIEEFVSRLIANQVSVLVDVRKNAISRKKGFSKTALSNRLERAEIRYFHFPDLGIPSEKRKDLDWTSQECLSALFDYYEDQILPHAADSIEAVKTIARTHGRVALVCFEANHLSCHRSRLASVIASSNDLSEPVTHL